MKKLIVGLVLITILAVVPVEAAKWTIMVYMDGDNDLEEYAIDDFLEMASVGSTQDVNVVVLFDRVEGYDDSYGDWTTAKIFYIEKGIIPDANNASDDWDEVNMGDPQTLIDFVNWSVNNYSAEHYALILWNHGSGWKFRLPPTKGVCWDYTNSNDYLNSSELQYALAQIKSKVGRDLDIIGFDACLMGMEEIDYLINASMPSAIRVGSEEVEPPDGWPYDMILRNLTAEMTPEELAIEIVNDYYNYYSGSYQKFTLSAVYVNNTIDEAINDFAQAVENCEDYCTVANARYEVEEFSYPEYIDLYNFAELVRKYTSNETVKNAAKRLMDAINSSVIVEKHGSSHPNVHGVSIYFPDSKSKYDQYSLNYKNLKFANDMLWDEFLEWFYTHPTTYICEALTYIYSEKLPKQPTNKWYFYNDSKTNSVITINVKLKLNELIIPEDAEINVSANLTNILKDEKVVVYNSSGVRNETGWYEYTLQYDIYGKNVKDDILPIPYGGEIYYVSGPTPLPIPIYVTISNSTGILYSSGLGYTQAIVNFDPKEDIPPVMFPNTTSWRTIDDFSNVTNLVFEGEAGMVKLFGPINLLDDRLFASLFNLTWTLKFDPSLEMIGILEAAGNNRELNKTGEVIFYNVTSPIFNIHAVLEEGGEVEVYNGTTGEYNEDFLKSKPVIIKTGTNYSVKVVVKHWSSYRVEELPYSKPSILNIEIYPETVDITNPLNIEADVSGTEIKSVTIGIVDINSVMSDHVILVFVINESGLSGHYSVKPFPGPWTTHVFYANDEPVTVQINQSDPRHFYILAYYCNSTLDWTEAVIALNVSTLKIDFVNLNISGNWIAVQPSDGEAKLRIFKIPALGQQAVVENSSAFSISSLKVERRVAKDGEYLIYIYAEDSYGNSDTKTEFVRVDNSAVTLPPLPGLKRPPRDLDKDGVIDDFNGNGRLDFDDVVELYKNLDWIRQNYPIDRVNLNRDDKLDFEDVVELFKKL